MGGRAGGGADAWARGVMSGQCAFTLVPFGKPARPDAASLPGGVQQICRGSPDPSLLPPWLCRMATDGDDFVEED